MSAFYRFLRPLLLVFLASFASLACSKSTDKIAWADLPREAQETIALIEAGGPFPYSRDGIVFQNRERLLPWQKRGYYREYTVKTPYSRTRGARRIISGAEREYYYTADHYNSFQRVTLP